MLNPSTPLLFFPPSSLTQPSSIPVYNPTLPWWKPTLAGCALVPLWESRGAFCWLSPLVPSLGAHQLPAGGGKEAPPPPSAQLEPEPPSPEAAQHSPPLLPQHFSPRWLRWEIHMGNLIQILQKQIHKYTNTPPPSARAFSSRGRPAQPAAPPSYLNTSHHIDCLVDMRNPHEEIWYKYKTTKYTNTSRGCTIPTSPRYFNGFSSPPTLIDWDEKSTL